MRYASEAQPHFDSAQSPGKHEVVETAQMADPKRLAGELA
jgi:hypothetical protein